MKALILADGMNTKLHPVIRVEKKKKKIKDALET